MPRAPRRTFSTLPAGEKGTSKNASTIARNHRRRALSPLSAEYERARANRGNRVSSKLKKLRNTEKYKRASGAARESMENMIRVHEEEVYQSDRAAILDAFNARNEDCNIITRSSDCGAASPRPLTLESALRSAAADIDQADGVNELQDENDEFNKYFVLDTYEEEERGKDMWDDFDTSIGLIGHEQNQDSVEKVVTTDCVCGRQLVVCDSICFVPEKASRDSSSPQSEAWLHENAIMEAMVEAQLRREIESYQPNRMQSILVTAKRRIGEEGGEELKRVRTVRRRANTV